MRFTFDATLPRVGFGAGCLSLLASEADRLGAQRILLVGSHGRSQLLDRAADLLGARVVGRFDEAVVHVPDAVATRARASATAWRADSIVAIGGGSPIGVAKAIALDTGLPIIAVPTTYSGSEMTPTWGVTRDGSKQTGRNLRVQPKTVLYDPELTISLPVSVSTTSGMNAMAHCVEALYAPDANPITSWMAEEGIRSLGASLPAIAESPADIDARTTAMYGGWLAGAALGVVQMGLHHKLCHVLGGAFDLPHAPTHAVLLPYTTSFNAPAAREAMSRIARALGAADAAGGLFELGRRLRIPDSLEAIGMRESDIDHAAALAVERPYPNPRPVTRDAVKQVLEQAFTGVGPRTVTG